MIKYSFHQWLKMLFFLNVFIIIYGIVSGMFFGLRLCCLNQNSTCAVCVSYWGFYSDCGLCLQDYSVSQPRRPQPELARYILVRSVNSKFNQNLLIQGRIIACGQMDIVTFSTVQFFCNHRLRWKAHTLWLGQPIMRMFASHLGCVESSL
jgi:hypothetical protein